MPAAAAAAAAEQLGRGPAGRPVCTWTEVSTSWVETQMRGQAVSQGGRQTDKGRTDGRPDRQTDRQTDT